MIEWEPERPETAAFRCPHCESLIDEQHKPAMVEAGHWRATRPEVSGHHGYRLNALVSPLANASWAKLAAEFLQAKHDPAMLQPFVNTVLAQGWRAAESDIDESDLAARAEPFALDAIPAEVLVLVRRASDLQVDRIETHAVAAARGTGSASFSITSCTGGLPTRTGSGGISTTSERPAGSIRSAARSALTPPWSTAASRPIASIAFCFPRAGRRVMAGKGQTGARPIIAASKSRISDQDRARRSRLDRRRRRDQDARCSRSSRAVARSGSRTHWSRASTSRLASERVVTRYSRGQPVRMFERIAGKRAEALDAVVYATAAKAALGAIAWDARELALSEATPQAPAPPRRPAVIRSAWLERPERASAYHRDTPFVRLQEDSSL